MAAKDSETILKWYDAIKNQKSKSRRYYHSYNDLTVADAVSNTHPQRTLEIYQAEIESLLPKADKRNYSLIGQYLKKLKPVYKKLKREKDWQKFVDELRYNYRSRPRFVDVLDKLDGKTILQSKQRKTR